MIDPVTRAVMEALEAFVDRHGMAEVLDCLSTICSEKAEHVRSAWQDEMLAKAWDRDAATLDRARARVTAL